jgi:hypothetical protein
MTQKVVHKMGVVNDMYYFFTKNVFLSNCHIMKKKILISSARYGAVSRRVCEALCSTAC